MTTSIPDDVVWARGVRFHLQAVYATAAIVALVAFLGGAAVAMAGPLAQDPPVTAGVFTLMVSGGATLVGMVVAGIGQLKVLRAAGGTTPVDTVTGILQLTQRWFAHLPRFIGAGCVALALAYSIWLPAGLWGVLVGGFVAIQVIFGLILIRRRILDPQRLHRAASDAE